MALQTNGTLHGMDMVVPSSCPMCWDSSLSEEGGRKGYGSVALQSFRITQQSTRSMDLGHLQKGAADSSRMHFHGPLGCVAVFQSVVKEPWRITARRSSMFRSLEQEGYK